MNVDPCLEELTPQDNVDTDKAYDKQMKWALENPNVRNIAITGPYGSGKSSILKTFQKAHREYKFLNLSLASFSITEKPKKTSVEKEGKEEIEGKADRDVDVNYVVPAELDGQLVEFSLLQQILLHIRHSKLPGSRFHRIRHQRPLITSIQALFVLLFSAAFIKVLFPIQYDKIEAQFSNDKDEQLFINGLPYLFLLGCIVFVYYLLRAVSGISVSKIKITDAEVDLAKKNLSVLNKYIEEILYFFEVTKYEVVIIEDLDRFGSPAIFTKLREINQLISNSEQVKHKVVFVYLLGDSVFKGEERTKFFDFIIPVIPVVNSSNSYQLLTDRIKKAKLTDALDDDFISDISLYITDMRLLKNIMNEFSLYAAKLKNENVRSLNDKQLFSMLVFKNKYPDDFTKLHEGTGKVADVFNGKENYINENIKELNKLNREIEDKIKFIEESVPQRIEELNLIYASRWLSLMKKQPAVGFLYDGQRYFLNDLAKKEVFELIVRSSPLYYVYMSGSNSFTNQSIDAGFSNAEKLVDPLLTYEQKCAVFKSKSSSEIKELRNQLFENKEKIRYLKNASLKVVLKETSGEQLLKCIGEKRLIVFLLRNGFINEEYIYYISYFYEGSLQQTDLDFILSVKDQIPKPYDFTLSNTAAILKRLRDGDFKTTAILNLQLMDHLLLNSSLYKEYIQLLFHSVLGVEGNSTDEFSELYISSGKAVPVYVSNLARHKKDWWKIVYTSAVMKDEEKDHIYGLIIKHAGITDIIGLNYNSYVDQYLCVFRDFQISDDRLIQLLDKFSVDIETVINNEVIPDKVMEYVYENNRYVINPEMIRRVMLWKLKDANLADELKTKHFTVIQESGLDKLIAYINEYIPEYIEDVYLQIPENTKDSETMVLDMISRPDIPSELIHQVLLKVDTKFSTFSIFSENHWDFLLVNNKILADWKNLLAYFEKYTITSALTHFINFNDNAEQLSKLSPDSNLTLDNMAKELFLTTEIENRALNSIASQFPKTLEGLPIDQLPIERIMILLHHDLIDFDTNGIELIQQRSRELALDFLHKNIIEYLEDPEKYDLHPDILAGLITAKHVPDEQKSAIVVHISPDKFEHSPLATAVAGFIKDRNSTIQFANLLQVLQYSTDLTANLTIAAKRLAPFERELDTTNVSDQLLSVLGEEFADIRIKGKKPLLRNTPPIRLFIEALEKVGYISSYKIENDGIRVYTRMPDKEQE